MKDFLLHMVTVICAETPKSAEKEELCCTGESSKFQKSSTFKTPILKPAVCTLNSQFQV